LSKHRLQCTDEGGGISETRSSLYERSEGKREERQREGCRNDGDIYGETRMRAFEEREREKEASRGGRKWPVQGGWNHLGFRYIER